MTILSGILLELVTWKMGFNNALIDKIIWCISMVEYSVINRKVRGLAI